MELPDFTKLPPGTFYSHTTTYFPCDFINIAFITSRQMIESICEFQIEVNTDNFEEIELSFRRLLNAYSLHLVNINGDFDIRGIKGCNIRDDIEIEREENYTNIDFYGEFSIEVWRNQNSKHYIKMYGCNNKEVKYHSGGSIVYRLLSYDLDVVVLACCTLNQTPQTVVNASNAN